MIEHETLSWKSLGKFRCNRQMSGINQNIVGQSKFLKQAYAANEVGLQQKTIIWFALHDVTNTEQFGIFGELSNLRSHIGRPQVNPAHHSDDERRCSQFQKPPSLREALP